MSVIVRIDVDRPFGKRDSIHRLTSRIRSEAYFPRMRKLHYLGDLNYILQKLNLSNVRSYVFFRRCSLPDRSIMDLMERGGHKGGMHLENSRSFESFKKELRFIESHLGRGVVCFSKHGSGVHKYGLRHYAPYEPEKYLEWGAATNMGLFFGNLEDPRISEYCFKGRLRYFPSAFWLEEEYRDIERFNPNWLVSESLKRDVVLLFHPDNVTTSPKLTEQLEYILSHAKMGF